MKCTIFLIFLGAIISEANAEAAQRLYPHYEDPSFYYGEDFARLGNMQPSQLRKTLFRILNNPHTRDQGKPDKIVEKCKSSDKACFPVRSLSYKDVRRYLFGHVYLERDADGGLFIAPIYCDKKITNGISEYSIPSVSETGLNTEHVFPKAHFRRSRSSSRYGEMKTDIHHLAPSMMKVNSFRGSFHFGYPNTSFESVSGCPESVRGIGAARDGGQVVFLPRSKVRGDVARMVMYFSVRFNVAIQNVEEGMLRSWHESDPVDNKEYERNRLRYSVQGNRNPFVDFPSLARSISDF